MDKHTLSQYGWVVSVILVLAIMISLATPFASVLSNGFKGAVNQFKDTGSGVLDNMGGADSFGDLGGGASGGDHGMGESGPVMLEGQDQSFHKFAPTTLTFRSSADIDEFQEVQVNGETIDPMYYEVSEVSEGSTVITLSMEYLATLESDKHLVTIVSNTGSATTEFEVVKLETNEHGFYYNQPYTANLPMFGGDTALFVRENGTYDIITVGKTPDTGEYTVSGNNIVATHAFLGTLTCTISIDGKSIYCNETAATFELANGTSIAADEDYIYVYDDTLGGYVVQCIDKTKAEYADIKTGINGIPTVKLADDMFFDEYDDRGNNYLTNIYIPDGCKIIGERALGRCGLNSITLPSSLTTLEYGVFGYCSALTNIVFDGTVEQWNAIAKGDDWNLGVPATEVRCSDGVVSLS